MSASVEYKVDGVRGLEYRDGWYHWRRTFHAKTFKKALRTKNFAKAVKLAEELNELIEDKKIPPTLALNRDAITLRTTLNEYVQSRRLRAVSRLRYTSISANIVNGMTAVLDKPEPVLTNITRKVVLAFVEYRLSTPISPNGHENTPRQIGICPKSVNDELMVLKAALKHAVRHEWLAKVPDLEGVSPYKSRKGKPSEVARPLEVEELAAAIQAAVAYDRKYRGVYAYPNFWESVIKTYVYSGLRRDELKYLEWTDVNFNHNVIKVRPKKVVCKRVVRFSAEIWKRIEGHINLEPDARAVPAQKSILMKIAYALNFRVEAALLTLKGSDFDPANGCFYYEEAFDWQPKASIGDVPMHPVLRETLQALEAQKIRNFVFPGTDGGYWRFHVDKSLKSIFKSAGISGNIRTHDLRHTCGYLLRRAGVGLETIKEILRHASIEETMVYAKYSQEEGQTAVNKLPKL